MRKIWLLSVLATIIVFASNDANAQSLKEKYRNKANDPIAKLPYYKKLREADFFFKQGSYFNAIEYYLQLQQEQERNPYLNYQLAECYVETRDYVNAARYYGIAYSLAPKLYPEALFLYALNTKQTGDYPTAVNLYNQFIKDNPKTFKKLKKRALREIEGCNLAIASMKVPEALNVKNAGPNVNTSYSEAAPYPLGDTALLFATTGRNEVFDYDKRKREEFMMHLMVSQKQKHINEADSFQWALLFNDGNFNSPVQQVSNPCFSPGGDRFYFSKCEQLDSMKFMCKIYVSEFKNAHWSRPQIVDEGGVNDTSSNSQPFIASVGKKEILYFSSNRKLQSRGGYDIWYSVYDTASKRYRRPQNAGKQINTEQDEITPYYNSKENRLYFASNGLPNFGGFDVFSADGGPSRYNNVRNLGYPINTCADEFYFIKDPVGKPDAYVVSNRIGSMALKNPTCCDDIYRIQYEPKLGVYGKVVNKKTNELISSVVVKMVDESGELTTFNSTDGKFLFNISRGHAYVFTGDKQEFTSSHVDISTLNTKRTDPDHRDTVTIYMDSITIDYRFRVSNILYDYDKSELRAESVASLDSLIGFMKDNPSLTVEINSFTDSKGDDQYNASLSQKRAQAVLDYLSERGVDRSRMAARGMGKQNPIAPNSINGKDNPKGRQANRRTEFKITADIPTKRLIFDSSKPGNIEQQSLNVENNEADVPEGGDTEYRKGGRVGQGN
jgi:OmpA-OmpF porin, OOP family